MRDDTRTPRRPWACDECGNPIPARRYAARVIPEQSNRDGPAAPYWYQAPRFDRA